MERNKQMNIIINLINILVLIKYINLEKININCTCGLINTYINALMHNY